MIHCVGNSHVWTFSGDMESFPPTKDKLVWFKTWHLGPVIAYNFVTSHLPTIREKVLPNIDRQHDQIMLVVGEVDCRWHLPRQAMMQKRSLRTLVQECVERFFETHLILQKEGYQVIAWGTHPTTTAGHCEQDTLIFGDVLTRNRSCFLWNEELQKLCLKNDIKYHSIYSHLVDDNNVTKMEYLRDYCHLNTNTLPFVFDEFGINNEI